MKNSKNKKDNKSASASSGYESLGDASSGYGDPEAELDLDRHCLAELVKFEDER